MTATLRESPPVQMRRFLDRSRAAGLPFERAWMKSMEAISWPHDTRQRKEWRDTLRFAKDEYRAAYEGEITKAATCSLLRDFSPEFLGEVGLGDTQGMMVAAAL